MKWGLYEPWIKLWLASSIDDPNKWTYHIKEATLFDQPGEEDQCWVVLPEVDWKGLDDVMDFGLDVVCAEWILVDY